MSTVCRSPGHYDPFILIVLCNISNLSAVFSRDLTALTASDGCRGLQLDLEAQRRKAEALRKKTDEEPDGQPAGGNRLRPMQVNSRVVCTGLAGVFRGTD